MKAKHFAVFAVTSILGLGLIAGCTKPEADLGSPSPEPTTQTSPVSPSPEATSEDSNSSSETSDADNLVFFTEDGIAIRGVDPVAYFQQGQPVQGNEQFSYQWANTTWLFSSAENRDLFASDPEQYAPEYGGFCAWAVSQGYTAPIDPEAWKIVDGKLYLNASRGVQRRWERDIPGNIVKGDQNWPGIRTDLLSQR
ncbi:MAG: YHS domain-containing protein [Cyanobacteria bacterium CRU_2_1]|nr:YHS domain-containing protein [Cyanobacteria bacterium RU_5_0]NJR60427.1 YHS domain-containing protein [Cyanobacteria bacterium CRU_2_1]